MTKTEELLLKWEKKRSEAKGGLDALKNTIDSTENKIMEEVIGIVDSFIEDLRILSNSKQP